MNFKKKLVTLILAFTMVLGLIPTISVKAATIDFDIVSATEVTAAQAKQWAKTKGATDTFVDLADLYWKYESNCGSVNPAIAYVQAAKETGYGKFGGVLDDTYNNPCGMKTSTGGGDYEQEAHQRFESWDTGIQAHMDHLALYAGAVGYPKANTYDPRHFASIKGKATTVNSLGTRWAPSATYGEEIGKLYMNLMDYANVDYAKDDDTALEGEPNPGKIESKPASLKAESVLEVTKPEESKKDETPNITSTIGWKMEGGKWYYYKSDNTKATGWIKPDANWYYLNSTGAMQTGWLKASGTWYYLDNSGAMATGWKSINGRWYFLKDSGAMATGIQHDGKNLYFLESSGAMITKSGWIKLDDKWYYSQTNGQVRLGWYKENNTWYYFQGDGSMVTGIKSINGKPYSFADSGAMQTGWKQVNDIWYYFDTNGYLVTGWIYIGSTYYYFYDNGAMAKGWQKLSGEWYYLNNSGAMVSGWVESNGDYYYLNPKSGALVTNTVIDGYKIGANGKRGSKVSGSDSNIGGNTPSTKKTIVVDAGHDYGKDFGAFVTFDGVDYSETVLNMELADKLAKELEKKGYNVIMTRKLGEKPSFTSLTESLSYRVNIANKANADLFISVHHNSAGVGSSAQGIETLYSSNPQDTAFAGGAVSNKLAISKSLATAVNNSMVAAVGATNRYAKDQNLYVCRNTNMPAILVEAGFLTHVEESKRCADPASQQKIAAAIADAVAKNF